MAKYKTLNADSTTHYILSEISEKTGVPITRLLRKMARRALNGRWFGEKFTNDYFFKKRGEVVAEKLAEKFFNGFSPDELDNVTPVDYDVTKEEM